MKGAKQFLEQNRFAEVDFGGYVASNSQKGVKYFVSKKGDKWACECVAGQMGKICKHIKKLAQKMGEDDRCFYCGITRYAAGGLDKHHVYRRSTHPNLIHEPTNLMNLCRRCHNRATEDYQFEKNLQVLWKIKKEKK